MFQIRDRLYGMSIRGKLLTAFLGVAGLVAVMGTVGLLNVRGLHSAIEQIRTASPLTEGGVQMRAAVSGDLAAAADMAKASSQEAIAASWNAQAANAEAFMAAAGAILGGTGDPEVSSTAEEGGQLLTAVGKLRATHERDFLPVLARLRDKAEEGVRAGREMESTDLGSGRYEELWTALERLDAERTALLAEATTVGGELLTDLAEVGEAAGVTMVAAWTGAEARVRAATVVMLLVMLLTVVVALIVAWAAGKQISAPLVQMMEQAQAIARGDLSRNLATGRTDEIGALATAFQEMKEALERMVAEISSLAGAVERGSLAQRGKPESFDGVYAELIAAVNRLVEAFAAPVRVTSDYVDRISKGDIPEPITVEYHGDFDEIKRDLNRLVNVTGRLLAETSQIAQGLKVGNLEVRADEAAFQGAWHDVLHKFNEALEALIEPNTLGFRTLQQAAAGDLTVRMDGAWPGAYGQMKDSINAMISRMDEGFGQVAASADQVASAAQQINSGSRSLAQGTSEQASTLEEVASSLQELSSMAGQSAANAREAKGLSDRARSGTSGGVASMKRLSEAMERIKASSDETAKIVKTIDEIAFQTNLLALNAAVEAARAGDAGKGFAVVAEEVRNLAMRSAEAAKSTAQLIEGSVKNAEGGVELNTEVVSALQEIQRQVVQVSEVMDEIAAGAEQQSQGVEQINTAMEQMNQVTQQTAANAEQSSSASEELTAQAEELRQLVAAYTITDGESAQPMRSRAPARASAPPLSAAPRRPNGKADAPTRRLPLARREELAVRGELC
jgi:methyl-accepting chemotaxis protein